MYYVIIRTTDNCYVCPPGRTKSYSPRLEDAQVYGSKAATERDLCVENERVVDLLSRFSAQPII